MPNNLGSAIGGQWSADFNTDSILKGFQLQGQRKQAGLAQQARLQAKVDKDKQNLQNQVLKYTDYSKIHPLLQPQASEDFSTSLSDMIKVMDSGDVDNYVQITKSLGDLQRRMGEYEGKSQLLRDVERDREHLTPQAQKMLSNAYKSGNIFSEDMVDKWGNRIQGGVVDLKFQPKVKPEQELLKAFNSFRTQTIKQREVPYTQNGVTLNRLETVSGIPATQEDAIKMGKTNNVVTADEIANELWVNDPQLRSAVMLSNSDALEKMFPDVQGSMLENPEAQEAARKIFEQSAINQARSNYKSQGLAQEANQFGGNFGTSGGGFSIGKNTFNFGKADSADELDFSIAVGDVPSVLKGASPEEIKRKHPNRPEIITIDPPNAAAANMTIGGKQIVVESFKYMYSEKQNKWFVVGTTKEKDPYSSKFVQKPIIVEINDGTYGGIFGVYKDAPKEAVEKMFNERLRAAGYDQTFKLTPNVPRQNKGASKSTTPNYGKRPDGTQKGVGFLGELKTPNGDIVTEYSTQSDAVKVNGKRIDFPTIVPTLTQQEVDLMLNDIIPNKKEIPESIMQKAIIHAKERLKAGKSVFNEDARQRKVAAKKTTTPSNGKNPPPTKETAR